MEVHITILTCKICQDQIILNTDNPKSWYPRIDFEEAGEETSRKDWYPTKVYGFNSIA